MQNKSEHISDEDLYKILNGTLILRERYNGENNLDYIINSCIPFIVQYEELLLSKMDAILSDVDVKSTLAKSPATTSNVNDRLRYIKNIIFANGEDRTTTD